LKLALVQPVLSAGDDTANMEEIRRIAAAVSPQLGAGDLLLLPEHFVFTGGRDAYDAFLLQLAASAGCTIVGGSHHRNTSGGKVNCGAVVSANGETVAEYSKLRPYFQEQTHVRPGTAPGSFTLDGVRVLVLICADFWYSDIILGMPEPPDLVLVPALSVSRKPSAGYAKSLWKHLAVTRAYEFGTFVGISDWAEDSTLPKYRTSGVAGIADPAATDPEKFFTPVPGGGATVTKLDFGSLAAFREDRRMRGFFWK